MSNVLMNLNSYAPGDMKVWHRIISVGVAHEYGL